MMCHAQAVQLHGARHRLLDVAKARVVLVGNGKNHHIQGFRDKSGFDGPIYVDPDLKLYSRMSLIRGVTKAFNMSSLLRGIAVTAAGFRQTRVRGDAWQQGGVFVIAKGGEVVWRYRSKFAGDHPSIGAVEASARYASGC